MIIGIGGISRGGKSYLAKKLKESIKDKKVIILHQDDYVFSKDKIPKIRNHIDWESPLSINYDLYYTSIIEAKKEAEIVIAEGLFAFQSTEINNLYTQRILVELPKAEFIRRKRRDGRWGYEEDWYIEHIWQSYLFYGRLDPNTSQSYITIDGSKHFDIKTILREIIPPSSTN